MSRDPRVDAYIARTAPFAQPILNHIRDAVHAGCPDVVETIKWGVPAFEYKGPFCGMAAFKKHTMFGFWKHKLMVDLLPKGDHSAFGKFGRLTSLDDLPSRSEIIRFVKAAKKLNDEGVKAPRVVRDKKPPVRVPPSFKAALKKVPKAATAFDAMPPSHKREYVEWIGQGKSRNWKYQR